MLEALWLARISARKVNFERYFYTCDVFIQPKAGNDSSNLISTRALLPWLVNIMDVRKLMGRFAAFF